MPMRALIAACFALPITICSPAMAQGGSDHDAFHYFYQGLRSPEGESCCNERDCHPVVSQYLAEADGTWTLEILIHNRWIKVPKDRILPQASPDGGVHACYSDPARYMTDSTLGLVIRCVIIGGIT